MKYSPGFERLLEYAAYDCAQRGKTALEVDHLTFGLFREDFPLVDEVLAAFRVDSLVVLDRLLRAHPDAPRPASADSVRLTPEALRAIDLAEREARRLGHDLVTPSHTLLGILQFNRDRLERWFIREDVYRAREEQVLGRVRELVSWLRAGSDGGSDREVGAIDRDTVYAIESRPLRGSGGGAEKGYAVRLRLLKQFRSE